MPDKEFLDYLEERRSESYFMKVWGYDEDDEEDEITDFSEVTHDDLLAVVDLLETRAAARKAAL